MKLRFSIHYRTEWGQQLMAVLSYRYLDGSERSSRVPLLTQDGECWQAETSVVESRRTPITSFSYIYIVADGDGEELRREWSQVPRTFAFDPSKTYVLNDQWRDLPLAAHLYTAAYGVTTHRDDSQIDNPLPLFRKTLLFRVAAPQLQAGQEVA